MGLSKAHQKIIREQKKKEDEINNLNTWWKNIDVDIKKAEVKPIERKQAKEIIEEYEWLKCMPAMVKYCFGIFFESPFTNLFVISLKKTPDLEKGSRNLTFLFFHFGRLQFSPFL